MQTGFPLCLTGWIATSGRTSEMERQEAVRLAGRRWVRRFRDAGLMPAQRVWSGFAADSRVSSFTDLEVVQ